MLRSFAPPLPSTPRQRVHDAGLPLGIVGPDPRSDLLRGLLSRALLVADLVEPSRVWQPVRVMRVSSFGRFKYVKILYADTGTTSCNSLTHAPSRQQVWPGDAGYEDQNTHMHAHMHGHSPTHSPTHTPTGTHPLTHTLIQSNSSAQSHMHA